MSWSGSDWSSDSEGDNAHLDGFISALLVRYLSKPTEPRPLRRRHAYLPYREMERQVCSPFKSEHLEINRPLKRPRPVLCDELATILSSDADAHEASQERCIQAASSIAASIRRISRDDRAETAMAVLRGLSDPLNTELRGRVLRGSLSSEALVAMDDAQLLNPETKAKIERERRERLEQKTVSFIERLTSTVTYMYVCPACGCRECYANFRSTDFVKWQGDDDTPTLLTCTKCAFSFRQ